jgi:hypothetical protein
MILSDVFNPVAYHLEKIGWAVFGTLTFETEAAIRYSRFAEHIHLKDFHWLIAKTASRLKLQTRNLAFYGKTEWSGVMRGHYNFLIARQGTEKVSPELLASTMQEIWLKEHAISKIEPFDAKRQRAGVAYQSKHEFDGNGYPLRNLEFISRALKAQFQKNAEKISENNPVNPGQGLEISFTA